MPHRYSPHVRSVVLTLLMALVIGGCSKKQDTVTGGTPPADTTTSGATISDDVRMASLDTLSSFFTALSGTDPAVDRQRVLAYFRTKPEFEASDISEEDGTVWARYTDGRVVMFVNNREPSSVVADPRVGTDQAVDKNAVLNKANDFFPGAPTARVLNSLGTSFVGAKASADSIRAWCKLVGYSLSLPNTATITNLKSMHGDGIFYWAAHGGYAQLKTGAVSKFFSMWTAERTSRAGDIDHKKDLDDHLIHYMFAKTDFTRGGGVDSGMHYSVTGEFIKKYMSFNPSGLVYFDACSSGKLEAGSLVNAGFYLGWSEPVGDMDASRAARYFFDKTLGVNRQTPKSSEPKRPFFIGDVVSEMAKLGIDKSSPARLIHPYEPVLTQLRLLVPSITLTSPIPIAQYYIDGDFGDDPGADGIVFLNKDPATKVEWTASGITIKQPESGGTLVVSNHNVKSNPVNLSEWHGTLDYEYKGRGNLLQHIRIVLNFWGDVHWYHQAIFSPASWAPYPGATRRVQIMGTSSCTFECSGEYIDNFGVTQERWSGSGTLPLLEYGLTGTGFSAQVSIDFDGTDSPCTIELGGMYTKFVKGVSNGPAPLHLSKAVLSFKHTDTDFSIKAGEVPWNDGTMTWTAFPILYPPDPKAGQ